VQHLPAVFAGGLPVNFIAEDGMSDGMEVNPNLVGSSRKNLAQDEGPTVRLLDDCKLRVSGSSPVYYGHFLAVHGMTANRLTNLTGGLGELPGTQREVELMNFSSCKLGTQPVMRKVVFGNHEATAGFFVEPMDDTRPKVTADATQISGMIQQGVNQCSRAHACPGVNDHAGRLVDDQHVLILEKNGQRNVLGPKVNRFRCRLRNGDRVPCADDLLGAAGGSVQQNVA